FPTRRSSDLDVLVLIVGQGSQIAPAEVVPGIERLAVNVPDRLPLSGGSEKETARELLGRRLPEKRRDGREDVNDSNGTCDATTRVARCGQFEQKRDSHLFSIEEDSVLVLSVIAESLAVVRKQDQN